MLYLTLAIALVVESFHYFFYPGAIIITVEEPWKWTVEKK